MPNQDLSNKIFHSVVARIIFGILSCFISIIVCRTTCSMLLHTIFKSGLDDELKNLVIEAFTGLGVLATYILLYHFYEKRRVTELSFKGFWPNAAIGLFTGLILQSLVILCIGIFGDYTLIRSNTVSYLLPGLVVGFSPAIIEEILFRGILFRLLEEKLGSILALVISASLFGLMHLGAPNSDLYSAFAIAVEAGILLAASYIYSRSLWLPIFLHFAWNFAEAGIYGVSASGGPVKKSLITSAVSGNEYITGGKFGPENSIQAILFCLAAWLIFLSAAKRQNKLIKPYWQFKAI